MRTKSLRKSGVALVATLTTTAALVSACGSDSQASGAEKLASGETLTIGVSTPQTGPLAINNEVAEGLDAYFKFRNANGGIQGHKVNVTPVDNQGSVAGGASAMRNILASKPFAVSVVSTAAFTGSQSVLKSASGTPALLIANGSAIKAAGLPNTFGLFTDYTTESFAGIKQLVSLGKKKIALVYDPTIGAQAAKQDADFAKKSGAQIVSEISVPATTTNYTPVVQKVRESGADGIVFQVAAPGLAGTMKAAGQAGLNLPAVSYSGLVDASVLKLGGTALEGVYFTALFPLLTATSPPVQEFSTQIKKYSADADTVLGLLGWNSGAIVEAAMKDSLKKGDLTQKSFMKSLHGLGGQQVGVLKTVGWTASDTHSMDAGNTDVFSIYQVKDGVFVKVGS